MFRTYQVFWNRLFQLIDAMIVIGSFIFAWYLKFHSGLLPYKKHLSIGHYLPEIFLAVPLFLMSNWLVGLYQSMRSRLFWQETFAITRSVIIGLLIFMSYLYVTHAGAFPRSVLVIFFMSFSVLTFFSHIGIRHFMRVLRSRGLNRKFVLLVGGTPAVNRFVEGLEHQPWFGYHIVGILTDDTRKSYLTGIPRLGEIENLQAVLVNQLIDHVIISLSTSDQNKVSEIVAICESFGIQSLIVPDYIDVLPANPRFESFAGMPLIDTRYVPLDDALNAAAKRAFDILFSALVLITLSPVYVAIYIMVKSTSPGPVIFNQVRVGKNRRQFTMYKFRTMLYRPDILPEEDVEWTTSGDCRRTPFGAFLRKTSLDELPQFWNVLKGDMSVIGPRPERPKFVEDFKDRVPKYMVKHRVRPGITGWAQVNGWRGDTSIDERIRCDIDYIENWSFGMDVRIFFQTMKKGFTHPNAY